jgi:hypothetical protein
MGGSYKDPKIKREQGGVYWEPEDVPVHRQPPVSRRRRDSQPIPVEAPPVDEFDSSVQTGAQPNGVVNGANGVHHEDGGES